MKLRDLIRLVLLLNAFYIVQCLCDDETKTAAKVAAAVSTDTVTTAPLTQKLAGQKSTASSLATAGRFPVFPFRTASGVLDSTLQGRVKIIERNATVQAKTKTTATKAEIPTAAVAGNAEDPDPDFVEVTETDDDVTKVGSDEILLPTEPVPTAQQQRSSNAKGRSIEFDTSTDNNLPASDQPFLEEDEFPAGRRSKFPNANSRPDSDTTSEDEIQFPAETRTPIFSGSKFATLKSGLKNLKALRSSPLSSSSYGAMRYNYRPTTSYSYNSGSNDGSASVVSRPTSTSTTLVVGPTTVPILGSGGSSVIDSSSGFGSDGGFDYDAGSAIAGTIPPFPSGGGGGAGGATQRPIPPLAPISTGGGSSSSNPGQIVPILTPGVRSRTRTSPSTTSRFDEPEFVDADYDDDDIRVLDEEEESLAPPVPSALPLTRTAATAVPTTLASLRSGRTRTRIIGSPGIAKTAASRPVKPIRRLISSSASPLLTTSTKLRQRTGIAKSATATANNANFFDADEDGDGDGEIIRDFVFSDINCMRSRSREYFGLKIHMKSGYHAPYIRDRPQDPLKSSTCKLAPTSGTSVYQMTVTDLKACGVESCADNQMCLSLVFPRLPSLSLADDEVTTIKCSPQKMQISEVRSISFQGDSLDNRKSTSTVEGGQQDFAAEVGVFRQNPGSSNGLFVKRVNSGGVVKLGEPLQLRSVVRGGDGWSHSILTDVKVWRMREGFRPGHVEKLNPGDASEVMTLVDSSGCRNNEYALIAEEHPVRDPRNGLVNHFGFKAFLFRGQRGNEPLIVTARVVACMEQDQCGLQCTRRRTAGATAALLDDDDEDFMKDEARAAVDVPAGAAAAPALAEDEAALASLPRVKRSPVEINNMSNIVVHDWNTHMALRVVGPNEELNEADWTAEAASSSSAAEPSCTAKILLSTFTGAFVMGVCCALGLGTVVLCKKKRRSSRHECDRDDEERFEFHRGPSTTTVGGSKRGPPQKQQQQQQQRRSSSHETRGGSRGASRKISGLSQPMPPPSKRKPKAKPSSESPNQGFQKARAKIGRALARAILDDNNNNQQQQEEEGEEECSRSESGQSGEEYECIEQDSSSVCGSSLEGSQRHHQHQNRRSRKDDFYIVYVGKKGAAGGIGGSSSSRSTSAPPSLRGRKQQGLRRGVVPRQSHSSKRGAAAEEDEAQVVHGHGDDGGDDDLVDWGAQIRRTVRSVKARNSRRSVSSGKGKNHGGGGGGKGGSGSTRSTLASAPPANAMKTTVQQHQQQPTATKHVNFTRPLPTPPPTLEDTTSSAEDSAYSGSTTVSMSTVRQSADSSSCSTDDSITSSLTHFVTRNESSTRILIIPETKV